MMLAVAVIGTGYIGKVHLETLLRVPGVQVKALADSNLALAQELGRQYGIPRVVADYRDLLDDPQLVAFHNCTPNHLHYAINCDLLEAGKHLLSEKPLSVTAQQARRLRDLAQAQDLLTAINFCYRYYPSVQEAAARVRLGELGRVHTVFGAYFQDWLLYETDYNWRLDKALSGESNTVADIGSHWLDLAQFVSNARITEVMADLRTVHPVRRRSRAGLLSFARQPGEAQPDWEDIAVEVDDYGSVLVHFENGAAGAFSVCQECAGRKCTIDLQVYGTRASLAWNHEHPAQLWLGQRDAANQVLLENPLLQHESTARFARLPSGHPMGYYDAVYNLFSEFYHGLARRKSGEPVQAGWPDFQDGYEEMAIIEAILHSHRTRAWATVGR